MLQSWKLVGVAGLLSAASVAHADLVQLKGAKTAQDTWPGFTQKLKNRDWTGQTVIWKPTNPKTLEKVVPNLPPIYTGGNSGGSGATLFIDRSTGYADPFDLLTTDWTAPATSRMVSHELSERHTAALDVDATAGIKPSVRARQRDRYKDREPVDSAVTSQRYAEVLDPKKKLLANASAVLDRDAASDDLVFRSWNKVASMAAYKRTYRAKVIAEVSFEDLAKFRLDAPCDFELVIDFSSLGEVTYAFQIVDDATGKPVLDLPHTTLRGNSVKGRRVERRYTGRLTAGTYRLISAGETISRVKNDKIVEEGGEAEVKATLTWSLMPYSRSEYRAMLESSLPAGPWEAQAVEPTVFINDAMVVGLEWERPVPAELQQNTTLLSAYPRRYIGSTTPGFAELREALAGGDPDAIQAALAEVATDPVKLLDVKVGKYTYRFDATRMSRAEVAEWLTALQYDEPAQP